MEQKWRKAKVPSDHPLRGLSDVLEQLKGALVKQKEQYEGEIEDLKATAEGMEKTSA